MKKAFLFILILTNSANLFSQIEKGAFTISLEGSYMKTSTGEGGFTNSYVSKNENLQISPAIYYFLTNNWMVGIGADYYRNKKEYFSGITIDDLIQNESMNVKSNTVFPALYFGYYFSIIGKLYFGSNIKFNYGKLKSQYNSKWVGYNISTMESYSRGMDMEPEVKYFTSKVYPELSYFVTERFSVLLGLGGIDYSISDWKKESANWQVNFNPTNWKFGVRVKI